MISKQTNILLFAFQFSSLLLSWNASDRSKLFKALLEIPTKFNKERERERERESEMKMIQVQVFFLHSLFSCCGSPPCDDQSFEKN